MQATTNIFVTRQLGNGDVMVNATQMAKPFGKDAAQFLMNKQTKDFIDVLNLKLGIPSFKTVKGRYNAGTWMHQKLALKFAGWLSPEFEFMILFLYLGFYIINRN